MHGQLDKYLHLDLGSNEENGVYRVELVGTLLALQLLANERGIGDAYTGIGNQAVLLALRATFIRASPHLFLALAVLTRTLSRSQRGVKIRIERIPVHLGIPGDVLADKGRETLRAIDPPTPSPNLHKTAHTRLYASLIIQISPGHIPVNAYLPSFQKPASPTCPACPACRERAEAATHYLMPCPSHKHLREIRIATHPVPTN